jgi:hypothetical protein
MNESLRTIANDVQGFKSIRHRLFVQASGTNLTNGVGAGNEAIDAANNKLYLYMFHLFESLVSNIAGLIQKQSS